MTTVMKPGIYEDVPYEVYRKWEGINQSLLMKIKQTPAHLKYALENGTEETDAMRKGHAAHTAILEPEKFGKFYVRAIEGDGRTKEIKAARAEQKEQYPNHTILDPEEYDFALEVADRLWKHPKAGAYLADSRRELSIVWEDKATGLLCKARLDGYQESNALIYDAKTSSDASPEGFARSIYNFNYHNQAAFYRSGATAVGLRARHHVFMAIEGTAPHLVAIYRLVDEVIELAEAENADLLRRYSTCVEKKEFPGYPEKVVDIGIPSYGAIKLEEKYGTYQVG